MTRWLSWVAVEWTIIGAALWAASVSWWLLPIALLVIGSRQHALGVLGHEAVHRAAGVPDWAGNVLTMWPILSDVATYRTWHLAHHQHVGTDLDPERAQREIFARWYTDLTPTRRVRILAADCLWLHAIEPATLLKVVMGPWSWPRRVHAAMLVAILAAFGPVALAAFFGSLFSTFWASMRWRIWHEHIGPDVTLDYTATWWQRALFVPHHIWRHVDHHRRWNVPAWDLR